MCQEYVLAAKASAPSLTPPILVSRQDDQIGHLGGALSDGNHIWKHQSEQNDRIVESQLKRDALDCEVLVLDRAVKQEALKRAKYDLKRAKYDALCARTAGMQAVEDEKNILRERIKVCVCVCHGVCVCVCV